MSDYFNTDELTQMQVCRSGSRLDRFSLDQTNADTMLLAHVSKLSRRYLVSEKVIDFTSGIQN